MDLRDNSGGSALAMLAGLGPLIGQGKIGGFVFPDGKTQDWSYRDGQMLLEDRAVAGVGGPPYQLKDPAAPVAVLIGGDTASAGEAIAVAFHGRPNTRSFGSHTAGLSVGNAFIPLSDGAGMALTESTMADRNGHPYGDVIDPDQTTSGSTDSSKYGVAVPDEAVSWLLSQPACAGR